MARYVGAIDQGTTSTRFMIFDATGAVVGVAQKEHEQIYPAARMGRARSGRDLARTREVIARGALVDRSARRRSRRHRRHQPARNDGGVGSHHRGTGVQRDRVAGHARRIRSVASSARRRGRTASARARGCRWRRTSPVPKCVDPRQRAGRTRTRRRRRSASFGTIDTWLVWNLTGGVDGGVHVTDVTNASRTMLMDLATLDWCDQPRRVRDPRRCCPRSARRVRSTAKPGCRTVAGVPVAGILGDQQAALFGQTCFDVGDAKNTYGTGYFLLLNTGTQPVQSRNGLLTTVALPHR